MSIGYGHAEVEQMIGIGLEYEAELPTMQYLFQGKEKTDAAIWVTERASNKRGESIKVRYAFPAQDDAAESENVKTIGEAPEADDPLSQEIFSRWLKKGGVIRNRQLAQDLVTYDVEDHQYSDTTRNISQLMEKWLARQACGTTAFTKREGGTGITNNYPNYGASWGNPVTAPNTENHLMCRGSSSTHTTEAQVAADTSAVMTDVLIREMEKRASSQDYGNYTFAPCDTPYGPLFVCLVHPDGFQQLKDNNSGNNFYDLASRQLNGGQDWLDNYLVQGGEGFILCNTLVLRWQFAPQGQASSTTVQANSRRGSFFGRHFMNLLYGEGFGENGHWQYKDFAQLHDLWYEMYTVQGGVASIVDGKRWASFVFTHYSTV